MPSSVPTPGPAGAKIYLSPKCTYPHQAPAQTHTSAAQHRSSLAANLTEHTSASPTASPPRSGRCFMSGPSHMVSEHRPRAGTS